jgi:hypothetical protein
MAQWISPPLRGSAATPFNWGVEATFAADRPVGQSLMDERVNQQTRPRSPTQRTTVRAYGCDHFGGFLLCSYVRAWISSPLRFPLRGRLRPSFRPSFRGPARPKTRQRPSQRRLRAWRFADIHTPPPVQNIESVPAVVIALSIFSASLALDACAIATALAPQRSSTASATVIASALATTQRPIGFALSPQLFAVNRSRAWRSA